MELAENENLLIQRLLTLVNLKKISSTKQVERLAENIPGLTARVQSYGGDINQPRALQELLRSALDKILSSDGDIDPAVVGVINGQIQRVKAGVLLTPDCDLMINLGLFGCDAIFGYALALLVDKKRKIRERLAKCDAQGCGRYLISVGRGRTQHHCNEAHRRAADKPKSKARSQLKRDTERALKLFGQGKSKSFVAELLNGRLCDEHIDRIAERAHNRGRHRSV